MQEKPEDKLEVVDTLIDKFWNFLRCPELNSVLSGYFCKIFQSLVGAKPRLIFQHVFKEEEIFGLLLKHLY